MHQIVIQFAANRQVSPSAPLLRKWTKAALGEQTAQIEITIRIVDIKEMIELNTRYRHKNSPTNVLSFPADVPKDIDLAHRILGDIVICADVVNREAREQQKTTDAHWAHMVVHGIFHLLGYDHENEGEAEIMEALEIGVMKKLGFPNPYTGEKIIHHE